MWLPYKGLITRILFHAGFYLEEELKGGKTYRDDKQEVSIEKSGQVPIKRDNAS